MINPLGFSLENFDAVGRWRTKDNNKPVNARERIRHRRRQDGPPHRPARHRELRRRATRARHRAFVRQLFHHTVKQTAAAFGHQTLDKLRAHFAANGFNIQKLLVEIALVAAMRRQPDCASRGQRRRTQPSAFSNRHPPP